MRISYYVQRFRELGIGEGYIQAKEIALARTSTIARRVYDKHVRKKWDEKAVLQLSGFQSAGDLFKNFRERTNPRFFFDNQKLARIEEFRRAFPEQSNLILKAGERALQHHFDILGSGLTDLNAIKSEAFKTIGTDGMIGKTAASEGGLPWHVDFKSRTGWDARTYYKDIRYGHIPGVDVKVPWELSRFHHLIVLGQAYLLTGNEQYPREFQLQVDDWITSNPCRFGVNWSCTMEVGIRAVNWIWGIYLLRNATEISAEFFLKFLTSLYNHAIYIRGNLEFRVAWVGGQRRRLNSNHYLSNIVGLLYIAMMFPELKLQADEQFALKELAIELMEQTSADGVDYEHSTFYHRLVLEMFLSGFLLAHLNGHLIDVPVNERLKKMSRFVIDYTRPDGSAPQIGDNDNGRLHPLSVRNGADHSYLPTLAAEMLGEPELKTEGDDPELWWLCDVQKPGKPTQRRSSGYATSGFYVMRTDNIHIFISAARVGMCGLGSHSHNDLLSFEYWAHGQPWIIDPGTYAYTSDPDARNLFRSMESHNGVRVDGKEINPFRKDQLFQLMDRAEVLIHEWKTGAEQDVLDVEHRGYYGSGSGILHRRRFEFRKKDGLLIIDDSFEGSAEHQFEWKLHLHPSVTPHPKDSFILLEGAKARLRVETKDLPPYNVAKGWYSPSYGVRQDTSLLEMTVTSRLPFSCTTLITNDSTAESQFPPLPGSH